MLQLITEDCTNSVGMEIVNYRVVLDSITIGDFRDYHWAKLFLEEVERELAARKEEPAAGGAGRAGQGGEPGSVRG